MDSLNYNHLKLANLKVLARERKIRGYSKLRKHELVDLLSSYDKLPLSKETEKESQNSGSKEASTKYVVIVSIPKNDSPLENEIKVREEKGPSKVSRLEKVKEEIDTSSPLYLELSKYDGSQLLFLQNILSCSRDSSSTSSIVPFVIKKITNLETQDLTDPLPQKSQLYNLSMTQLKDLAKKRGISNGISGKIKDQIVQLLDSSRDFLVRPKLDAKSVVEEALHLKDDQYNMENFNRSLIVGSAKVLDYYKEKDPPLFWPLPYSINGAIDRQYFLFTSERCKIEGPRDHLDFGNVHPDRKKYSRVGGIIHGDYDIFGRQNAAGEKELRVKERYNNGILQETVYYDPKRNFAMIITFKEGRIYRLQVVHPKVSSNNQKDLEGQKESQSGKDNKREENPKQISGRREGDILAEFHFSEGYLSGPFFVSTPNYHVRGCFRSRKIVMSHHNSESRGGNSGFAQALLKVPYSSLRKYFVGPYDETILDEKSAKKTMRKESFFRGIKNGNFKMEETDLKTGKSVFGSKWILFGREVKFEEFLTSWEMIIACSTQGLVFPKELTMLILGYIS